jgi:hypothetical protein
MTPVRAGSIAWIMSVFCLLQTGCGWLKKEPQHWKIDAKTPAHLDAWNDEHTSRMPEDLRKEYIQSFNWLMRNTPGSRTKKIYDQFNPLCERIHRLTVRDIVIAGYLAANESFTRELNIQNESLVKNLAAQNDGLPEKESQMLALLIENDRSRVERYEQQLAENLAALERFKAKYP